MTYSLRAATLALFCSFVFSASAFAELNYPMGPDPRLTQGSYCTHPDSYRYPEHIPYCRRDVPSARKRQVIDDYNHKLGYNITPDERRHFKIDHLIPLCMGGGNDEANLWPQHESVFVITDPLEGLACEKMAQGRLLQKRAVDLLMRAKNHLDDAPEVQSILEAL
jgi:hypothetical protein